MKKSKFLLSLSAFAFAIVGAFASMNIATAPANLYTKATGTCQLECASTGTVECEVPGPYYNSLSECQNNQNPIQIAFRPE